MGRHVLVLRFAALGDVATMSSVLMRRAALNPDCQFTILTHPMLMPLFSGASNVRAVPMDKSLGIWRIFRDLNRLRPTHVVDGHNNLRTICLRILFFMTGRKVVYLHKYRRSRRRLTRYEHKVLEPMIPWWRVYDRMLDKCGLAGGVRELPVLHAAEQKETYRIGVAPFANYKGKIWPLQRMEEMVRRLSSGGRCRIYLFGGASDRQFLDGWAGEIQGVVNVAGTMSFADELELIRSLDLMVSMDSANMHFASWAGVPVVSVWGATHPYAGFYGWCQDPDWAVQCSMPCRPCSTNGSGGCLRGDYACMNAVTVDMVMDKVRSVLPGV